MQPLMYKLLVIVKPVSFQDEKNEIMTTNMWVSQVRLIILHINHTTRLNEGLEI